MVESLLPNAVSLVEAGFCPFCGEGPFRVVASHSRMHGVRALELRDLLGIPRSRTICDPGYASELREKALESGLGDRLAPHRPLDGNIHASMASKRFRDQRNRKRDLAILRLALQNTMSIERIAAVVGCGPQTASRVCRHYGINPKDRGVPRVDCATVEFQCAWCGKNCTRDRGQITRNSARRGAPPCCSISCSARLRWWTERREMEAGTRAPSQRFSVGKYKDSKPKENE